MRLAAGIAQLSGTITMVKSAPKLLTVDEFITQYGDCDRYELIDGELIDMEPTGPHDQEKFAWQRNFHVRQYSLTRRMR